MRYTEGQHFFKYAVYMLNTQLVTVIYTIKFTECGGIYIWNTGTHNMIIYLSVCFSPEPLT